MAGFAQEIEAYGAWRRQLAEVVRGYAAWLVEAQLSGPQPLAHLDRIQQQLLADRLNLAFVAEFSRGKSELINAIFFAGYGRRIVPSSAGRTTMCPTELLWDERLPPSIRLLPIESRLRDVSLAELRDEPGQWHEIGVDPDDVDALVQAFRRVSETRRVRVDDAVRLGLYDAADEDSPLKPDADGTLEISRWRHAIVNLPHPLLAQGLVIIDTPGLNAIGAEPELTFGMIPASHAVLYVLAADTGVTRSDIEVWTRHIGTGQARYVVLNKIDGLWDGLRSQVQVDDEIERQVMAVSRTLGLPRGRVFPVSAQKGLLAKVRGDQALFDRSRLGALERALSEELIPSRRAIVARQVRGEFDAACAATHALLTARRRATVDQVHELSGLRGKNRSAIEVMATRIRGERTEFEEALRQLQALRTVLKRHGERIYASVGVESLKRHVRRSRESMHASAFSTALRDAMGSLLGCARDDVAQAGREVDEVAAMMGAMYRTFSVQYGMSLGVPIEFSMKRYLAELARVEDLYRRRFGALSLLTQEKRVLMRRFFESVVARIRDIYAQIGRDVESWLRALMAPLESQVREHQVQLRKRLDSVKRVFDASESLDARLLELEEARAAVEQQLAILDELAARVRAAIEPAAQVDVEPAYA